MHIPERKVDRLEKNSTKSISTTPGRCFAIEVWIKIILGAKGY